MPSDLVEKVAKVPYDDRIRHQPSGSHQAGILHRSLRSREMSDIVERLRECGEALDPKTYEGNLMHEAADIIERQAKQLERAREALNWIMEQGDGHIGPFTSTPQMLSDTARAALKEIDGE